MADYHRDPVAAGEPDVRRVGVDLDADHRHVHLAEHGAEPQADLPQADDDHVVPARDRPPPEDGGQPRVEQPLHEAGGEERREGDGEEHAAGREELQPARTGRDFGFGGDRGQRSRRTVDRVDGAEPQDRAEQDRVDHEDRQQPEEAGQEDPRARVGGVDRPHQLVEGPHRPGGLARWLPGEASFGQCRGGDVGQGDDPAARDRPAQLAGDGAVENGYHQGNARPEMLDDQRQAQGDHVIAGDHCHRVGARLELAADRAVARVAKDGRPGTVAAQGLAGGGPEGGAVGKQEGPHRPNLHAGRRTVARRAPGRHADERTRTSTESPPHGPEPCASTNSATSARPAGDNSTGPLLALPAT